MASKRCPACQLVNPGSALRCDCGRSFVDGTRGEPLAARLAPADRKSTSAPPRSVWTSACWALMFVTSALGIKTVLSATPFLPRSLGWLLILVAVIALVAGLVMTQIAAGTRDDEGH